MKKKEYSKPEMQVIELRKQQLLQASPFDIYDDPNDYIDDEGQVM